MLTPLPAGHWDFESAAHLLNRAGFGGPPEEIDRLRRPGLEAAVAGLLHPPNDPADDVARPWMKPTDLRARRQEMRRMQLQSPERKARRRNFRQEQLSELSDLVMWWLMRMRKTRAPLVEKMTLFWHGHFATSAQKVKDSYWMWRQNDTFRRHALGSFSALLQEMSRDPAMMFYLDLHQSRKQSPNENWAREVMELFTLGIGHYTEQDVRESARAFTGYRINEANQQFYFDRLEHDPGPKAFLGRSGPFSGDDILRIITEQPACPELIGRKLCRYFVVDEPAPELVQAVASSLRKNDFQVRPVLQEIFSSAEFYSERVRHSQIKSPVQFLVQSCKLLETDLPPEEATEGALRQMGQLLLAPPNVKGWDGGKSWIGTSTLLFRYNFANYLLSGTLNHPNAPANLQRAPADLSKIIPLELRKEPEALIAQLSRHLYQSAPGAKLREAFLGYLETRAPDRSDDTMRSLIHLMMSTPHYQLT